MAKHARNPQEIQAIQKSLITGVQNGSIQPYIGIPLIQDLTKKLTEAKAKMAESIAGAGMQQPPAGGPPIAQQVMQQAAQADQSQGVEALPSNLPQSYAGGGIIAFGGGGEVEHYVNQGVVPALGYEELVKLYRTDPQLAKEAALRAGPMGQRFLSGLNTAVKASTVPLAIGEGGAAASIFANGVTGGMSPEQRAGMYSNPMLSEMSGDTGLAAAIQNAPNMGKPTMGYGEQMSNALSFFPKTLISAPGDTAVPKGYGFTRLFASDNTPAVAPTATSAAPAPVKQAGTPDIPSGASAPSKLPGGPGSTPGGINFKMPTLPTMKDTPAPVLKDYDSLVSGLPEKSQTAFDDARKKEEDYLRGITAPGEQAREDRFGKREAQLEKDSSMSRALGLISTGFGIAGSKERTLAGALGNEGRQGIEGLIRGEAANRVAKERLEDARDNFEQQKIAAAKGDRAAANAAGQRASEDVRVGTQMTMQAAHYGNTDALNRYQTQQQGEYQKASLGQSGVLGLAGLNLQAQHLAQTGAFQNKQLDAMTQRYAAMDKASQARMMQVRVNAMGKFNETIGPQLNAQLTKEYGPNWRTSQDPRSLEAQMKFKQQQNAYLIDALGQHDDRMSARDSSDL
jgi:hypothetical protein